MLNKQAILELSILINKMVGLQLASGISYSVTPDSKNSFLSLIEDSKKKHLIISSEGSQSSIYPELVNIQFRFWHDCIHCLLNKDFSLEGETAVINYQIKQLKMLGISKEALAVFHADTIGQIRYYYKHKQFVNNQYTFVSQYLNNQSLALC